VPEGDIQALRLEPSLYWVLLGVLRPDRVGAGKVTLVSRRGADTNRMAHYSAGERPLFAPGLTGAPWQQFVDPVDFAIWNTSQRVGRKRGLSPYT